MQTQRGQPGTSRAKPPPGAEPESRSPPGTTTARSPRGPGVPCPAGGDALEGQPGTFLVKTSVEGAALPQEPPRQSFAPGKPLLGPGFKCPKLASGFSQGYVAGPTEKGQVFGVLHAPENLSSGMRVKLDAAQRQTLLPKLPRAVVCFKIPHSEGWTCLFLPRR